MDDMSRIGTARKFPIDPATPDRRRKRTTAPAEGRALIVGAAGAGAQLAEDLRVRPDAGFSPVAFLDEDRARHGDFFHGLSIAGAPADMNRHLAELQADTVFLCSGDSADTLPSAPEGVRVYTAVGFYEKVWRKIPPACVREEWLAEAGVLTLDEDVPAWERGVRRVADVLASGTLLLLLSPILLLAAVAVKLDSRGPVLYSQMRSGKGGQAFRLFKFRSMRTDAEKTGAPQWAQVRDPRITRVGRFLRLTRVDELPQLWNVLKGDMGLIGPRPERPEFDSLLAEQIPHYQVRYQIRPGISGWAQVMYPYGASVEDAREKLAFDLYYLKNRSLLLDMVITLRTVQVVLFGKGR